MVSGGASRGRWVLALAAGVVLLPLGGCQGVDTGVYWSFERMVEQPSYRAYEGSPLFPDGRVMRPPPGGTVPRGVAIGRPEGGSGDAARGEEGAAARRAGGEPDDVVFPVPLTPELLERGRSRFEIFCAPCHGVVGDGATPIAASMRVRRPPSLHEPAIREYSAERLHRIVAEGYGVMPAYAGVLSWEERWGVVAYVRALQLSQRVVVSELPEPVRGEVLELLRGGGR